MPICSNDCKACNAIAALKQGLQEGNAQVIASCILQLPVAFSLDTQTLQDIRSIARTGSPLTAKRAELLRHFGDIALLMEGEL